MVHTLVRSRSLVHVRPLVRRHPLVHPVVRLHLRCWGWRGHLEARRELVVGLRPRRLQVVQLGPVVQLVGLRQGLRGLRARCHLPRGRPLVQVLRALADLLGWRPLLQVMGLRAQRHLVGRSAMLHVMRLGARRYLVRVPSVLPVLLAVGRVVGLSVLANLVRWPLVHVVRL